jgi:FHA domain
MIKMLTDIVLNHRSMEFLQSETPFRAGIDFQYIASLCRSIWSTLSHWAAVGYMEAPALMVGLAAIMIIPILAITGFAVNLGLSRRAQKVADGDLSWPRNAWITIEGEVPERRQFASQMLNIGREDDNDVQIEHASVHRHHALLHRASDALYYVRDLSGDTGNGIKVNGRRVTEAALVDGDRIEVGAVAVRFEAQPI